MLNKTLFIQILFYFLAPLLLAIIHSIVGINVASKVIEQIAQITILKSAFTNVLFILIIYGAYFVLTYTSSKNIINNI